MADPKVTEEPILGVAGLPRSGNSMVMQMLDAGGFPVVGTYPSYEDYNPFEDPMWLKYQTCQGRAVKLLSCPLSQTLPLRELTQRFIYVTRNSKERVASQVKFMDIKDSEITRAERRRLQYELSKESKRLKQMLMTRGPVLTVRFEEVLADPYTEAQRIATALGEGLDIEAMAQIVVDRDPECYEGFLEFQQLRDADKL